jgi:hypothetical protein
MVVIFEWIEPGKKKHEPDDVSMSKTRVSYEMKVKGLFLRAGLYLMLYL